MNDRELLPQRGQFYKANLHCHTVLSDGTWTKEPVKAEYQKKGYSIVAFTDHRHYGWHPELQDDSFLKTSSALFALAAVSLLALPLAVRYSLIAAVTLLAVTTASMLGINTMSSTSCRCAPGAREAQRCFRAR